MYWQISIEKYVPKHLISLLSNFWYIFCRLYSRMNRWILKRYPPKWMILEVDVHKLSNYRSVKRFMCLKWILKKFHRNTTFSVNINFIRRGSFIWCSVPYCLYLYCTACPVEIRPGIWNELECTVSSINIHCRPLPLIISSNWHFFFYFH